MTEDGSDSQLSSGGVFAAAHRRRFDILLGALVLLMLSAPVVRHLTPGWQPATGSVMITVAFTVMLLSAVFAVSQGRRSFIVALSLAIPAIFPRILGLAFSWQGITIASHVLGIAFLGYTVIVILRFLFAIDRVTLNMICASLCVYLLLGIVWAVTYSLIEILDPGSFQFSLAEEGGSTLMWFGGETSIFPLYFSFVTLTTLGYGDILPSSSTARMFTAIEALTGQVYLAVLVARLVGLHISQSTANRRHR